ncbi:MAG: LTA synthase family protein [Acidimicrobiia bacterium]|nr:LTA synthase family protein [Acidimicrobiia bacterium]
MWIRWYVPGVLLAIHPVAVIVGANLGTVPLRTAVVTRALITAAAAAVVLTVALRVARRDLAARSSWLAWFLIQFNLYGAAAEGLRGLGLAIWPGDPWFAVPYVLTAGVIAAIASRPWEVRPRSAMPLTVAAALLLLVAFIPAAAGSRRADPTWREAAEHLASAPLSGAGRVSPSRDVYYIVLDALGRPDALRRNYGLDLQPFVEALRARGFYVVERARANYAQTYLSLASALNLDYLDGIAQVVGAPSTTREPLDYLVQQNALMRLASRAGYRVVAFGSDYMATRQFDRADVCVCAVSGLDELEVAAIALTPLAAVPLGTVPGDASFDGHRRKLVRTLTELEEWRRGTEPTFVFAHILAAHAPFVIARDGSPLAPSGALYTMSEGGAAGRPRQEYLHGYAQQSQYVLDRFVAIVDAALRQPGPAPAIVVHGDHGPGLSTDTSLETMMRERMEIFAAYYFPDGDPGFYPTMTPVNGARLLARRYFGADLAPLPDRVLYSQWVRPYDFTPVPDPPPQDSLSPVRMR